MLTEFLRSFTLPGLEKKYIVADESLTEEGAAADSKKVGEELAKKVDKETGKALSTNDYTNAEKTKLAGVDSGAQVNTIEGVKVDGTEVTPDAQKKVNLNVYDKAAINAIVQEIYAEVAKKLNIDGYSEAATAGNALGLVTDSVVEDKEPYNYRSLAHLPVGKFCYDTIVGGSVVWNQLVKDGNFTDTSNWRINAACSVSFANNVATVTIDDNTRTSARPNFEPKTMSAPQIGHKYFVAVDINPSKDLSNSSLAVIYGGVFFLGASTANTWNEKRTILNAANTSNSTATLYIQQYITLFDNGDTLKYRNYNIIDLTAALPSAIADYIYSLEQTTAGAGVAWFRKYFPEVYYGYAEPHFEHVQVSAKNTVGFNQWDEEWRSGYYDANTGDFTSYASQTANKNPIKVLPNTLYSATMKGTGGIRVVFRDAGKNLISIEYLPATPTYRTFTTPTNCYYIDFCTMSAYGGTYKNDLCINFSSDRNGEYEPYKKRTYPLDSSLTLRGIPKLDSANRLYFYGDIYRHDGSGTRRFAIADAGTLNWTYNSTYNYFGVLMNQEGSKKALGASNFLLPGYVDVGVKTDAEMESVPNYSIAANSITGAWIKLKNTNYTSVASFKSAMSGVYLLFELLTPEPFTSEPFQSPMVIDPLGTEEFVDYAVEQGDRDVKIPCGHTSEYPEDLVDKLEVLPHATGTNGDFLITEIDGKLYLKPYTQTVGLTSVGTEAE